MDAPGQPGQMQAFRMGRLQIGLVTGDPGLRAVQSLRATRFRGHTDRSDLDRFDPLCRHLLICESAGGAPLATARLRVLDSPQAMADSYTGQFYDLTALGARGMRLMEIGRICLAEDAREDPDALRALLAGLTRQAQAARIDMLMGCASFTGADPARHRAALAYLAARHVGPASLRPHYRSALALPLPEAPRAMQAEGLARIPPLLRMYLGMGGWVSDHAVRDPDLDTLHVFAAVEVSGIPAMRLRRLQGLAQG